MSVLLLQPCFSSHDGVAFAKHPHRLVSRHVHAYGSGVWQLGLLVPVVGTFTSPTICRKYTCSIGWQICTLSKIDGKQAKSARSSMSLPAKTLPLHECCRSVCNICRRDSLIYSTLHGRDTTPGIHQVIRNQLTGRSRSARTVVPSCAS